MSRILLLVGCLALGFPATVLAAERPPNLVLIMTDNHGPWTLGCYGNPDIKTPHIDRLAARGTLFLHAMANNAVCSPTRASVLTGLMPCQHGVHRFLSGPTQIGPEAYNTLEEFDTLPSILVQNGYVAGLCGKWHLGGEIEPHEGFSYWITKPAGSSAGFYDQRVIENGEIRIEPKYLTDLWTEHGVRFIQQNRDRPFFLFLSYNGPYGLGRAMREPIRNRHADHYADLPLDSFPRTEPQPWNFNYGSWIGDKQVIRKYAAEISGIDDGVGRIMQTLDEQKLTENTLVVFMADQGLSGGQAGYWGMGDHTRPLTAFDWTMTIPLIFHWPGKVTGGRREERMVSNYDLLPTILSQLGLNAPAPDKMKRPGRDFSAILRGESISWENEHFYEFENVRAIRTDRWKYIERIHQRPNELYDLVHDPQEHHNLYGDSDFADRVIPLRKRLYQFFEKHADPKWDLWRGGGTKTDLFTEKFFGIKNPYTPSRYLPDGPLPAYRAP